MSRAAVAAVSCALWASSLASCGEPDRAEAAVAPEGAREAIVPAAATRRTLEPPSGGAEDAHRRARDDARLVLERYCGSCHISAYETALPGALAVYDLLDAEGAARATELQLRDIVFRLGEPLGPDAEALDVSAAERETVERYVEAEIVRRAVASGLDPTDALPSTAGRSP